MKKILFVVLAAFALFSCNKAEEIITVENGPLAFKYVFNIAEKPSFDADTKAVKSSWSEGDKIYIVFDDVRPTALADFMILEYDGTEWTISQEGSNTPKEEGGTLDALYYENQEPANTNSAANEFRFDYLPEAGKYMYLNGNNIPYTVEDGTMATSLSLDFEKNLHRTYVQLRVKDLPESELGWGLLAYDTEHSVDIPSENDYCLFLPVWQDLNKKFTYHSVDFPQYKRLSMSKRDDGYYIYLSAYQEAEDITFSLVNFDTGEIYQKTFAKKISGKCAAISFSGPNDLANPTNGWKRLITFENEYAEAVCVKYWDTDEDGKLSFAEAAAVTDLGTVFVVPSDNSDPGFKVARDFRLYADSFKELKYFTGLTEIGEGAFEKSFNLETIQLPLTVRTISNRAFSECRDMESIILPTTITSIGGFAFGNCATVLTLDGTQVMTGIKSINIPMYVSYIAGSAFTSCWNLSSITVDEYNSVYDSRNSCNAIIETSSNRLVVGCEKTVIPEDVTIIGSFAFQGQKYLTSINIPDSVTILEECAFYGTGLTSVSMNTVSKISGFAFGSCTDLKTVSLPSTVTQIENQAFAGCNNLVSVTIEAKTPPTLGDMLFGIIVPTGLTIYVPEASVDAYKAAWTSYADIIKAIPTD